jgi:carbonic anhydrase
MRENTTGDLDKFQERFDRRQLLVAMGFGAPLLATPLVDDELQPENSPPKDAGEALARLKSGNARFADGKTRHAHESANWRKHLVSEQKPFATVLGCSDSRVPPELVFDQGFGDLFVVRVAGNVISSDIVASLSYAALHLETRLFVVMGHIGCGAVTAAVDAKLKKAKEPEKIEALVKLIEPGLKDVDTKAPYPAVLKAAVEANVRWSVCQLAGATGPKESIQDGRIVLVGAVYELETGRVRFLTG